MRVLVTGAGGQLGTALQQIAPEGWLFSDISGDFLHLDITDAAAVKAAVESYGVEAVVNCAGYTNVEGAEDDSSAAMLLNGTAPGILATAMKEVGGLIVHISTDYIFGGEKVMEPLKEAATPSPLSAYGISKLRGEEAVKASGASYVILRTAWMHSPWGKNFVKTILELTSKRESIKVVNDQTGTPTYAPDLASAIVTVLDKYSAGLPCCGIYNYTDEGSTTWYEFACEIARLSGNTSCRIVPCATSDFPTKAVRPAFSVLDKTLVKETYGIEIPRWEDSLRRCISAILES
ncbi:MAG: dTDP-4-dehydrorhamnose reductase [Bacteroidales bacterium]|nr:dTDP-4-dehydrorhamnose reductase [Bacteroidales bacterium]